MFHVPGMGVELGLSDTQPCPDVALITINLTYLAQINSAYLAQINSTYLALVFRVKRKPCSAPALITVRTSTAQYIAANQQVRKFSTN